MVQSGGSLAVGATVLAATHVLRDRSPMNAFIQSFTAPLQGLVPRVPKHAVLAAGRSTSSSGCGEALAATGIFIAAASRHRLRIGRSSRRAEDGDARSKKGKRKNNSEKALTDEVVEELDRKMVDCAQAEDYAGAARYRDQLCSAQLDDEAKVLQANMEFYEAFSKRDFERMKACWLPSAVAQCIHPYDKTTFILKGLAEISDSFKRVFEESKTKNRIVPDEVKVNLRGATAVVTCQEKIVNKSKVQSVLITTHVFRRGSQNNWLLMHRHASKPPGEWSVIGSESDSAVAWNARLQQLMRAAETLGTGSSKFVINTNELYDDDEDGDGPFGIRGSIEVTDDDDDSDDSDGEPDELYVEDDDLDLALSRKREAWKSLRRLVIDGWITPEEKIRVLADMLENPGESMVEKAQRLLLGDEIEPEDMSTAWEDYADLIALQVKKLKPTTPKESEGEEGKKD